MRRSYKKSQVPTAGDLSSGYRRLVADIIDESQM